jgi:phage terminase large subunit-like protein
MSSKSYSPSSIAEQLKSLPDFEREEFLASLTDEEHLELYFDWEVWSRPDQLIPPGIWQVWLILAGRGFGKTRTGAETVRYWVKHSNYVNLIGATADDARDIMVEGESGILAICPPDERPIYQPSKRRLKWPNGAISLIFTADEPERLRGKQHTKLWCDEVAAWKYEDSWDQAMFGLRLGDNPQAVATTTPKPTKLIRGLVKDPTVFVTRGSTYDNQANLAPTFLSKIVTKYEGTRLGRQELNAELLEDNPGALWNRAVLDDNRVKKAPDLVRIVVGVDPAATSNEDSDETGIIVAGRDRQSPPHFYILDDLSLIATPDGWAAEVVSAYKKRRADRIIGEVNNGGEMIEAVIRHKDPNVSYKAVRATRGKELRAEPIAALYEQGRVHHVGSLPGLEDQMCDWNPQTDDDSPDRVDAMVWALTELSDVVTAWIYRDAWSDELLYDEETIPIGLRGSGGYYERAITISYGTVQTCVFLEIYDDGENWWVDQEYYWNTSLNLEQRTDGQHAEALAELIGATQAMVIVDPESTTFQTELANRNIWHHVADEQNLNSIRTISTLLKTKRLRVHKRCENFLRELLGYAWDLESGEEKPVRVNDRSCVALQLWASSRVPDWRASQ